MPNRKPSRAADTPPPACSTEPCRRAYSREKAIDAARAWLAKTYGDRPQTCDTKEQDWWDAKEGMLVRFICDHFPSNASGQSRKPGAGHE